MSNFRRFLFGLALGGILLAVTNEAAAQRRKPTFEKNDPAPSQPGQPDDPSQPAPQNGTNPPGANAPAAAANKKEDKFAPQDVTLTVKDEGIRLVATWFPPIVEEEEEEPAAGNAAAPNKDDEKKDPEPWASTAPFILVHDWTRSRADLFDLGKFLQSQGHAVIIPDLRGHGDSTRIKNSNTILDYREFKKNTQGSAVADIDQCKRFLQDQNNEKIVNIDLLNVIAVGDSAHLAMAWAISDWGWEPVAGIQQGKDVKSLILFSPTKTFSGSTLRNLTKSNLISGRNSTPLPMLVIWGADSRIDKTCSDFIKVLRRNRPEVPKDDDLETRWTNQNLFHFDAPTEMEGYEIAGSPRAKEVWNFANDFVSQKVLKFSDRFPWKLRGPDAVHKARKALE